MIEPTCKRILRKRLDEVAITQEWFDYLLSRIEGNCFRSECGGLEQWECCGLCIFGTDICPICKREMPVSKAKGTWKRVEEDKEVRELDIKCEEEAKKTQNLVRRFGFWPYYPYKRWWRSEWAR